MDFRFGSPVRCVDGPCTILEELVVDPQTRRITHLHLFSGEGLFGDVVIPFDLGLDADEYRIQLHTGRDECLHRNALWFKAPRPSGHAHQPRHSGRPRRAHHRETAGFDTNERGVIHTVIVSRGFIFKKPYAFPAEWIGSISEAEIETIGERTKIESAPEVTSRLADADAELVHRAENAVHSYEPLRSVDNIVLVDAEEGAVRLWGIVRTTSLRTLAEELVRKVPGVKEVENLLFSDDEVTIAVGNRLGSDARTRSQPILVHSRAGVVTSRHLRDRRR